MQFIKISRDDRGNVVRKLGAPTYIISALVLIILFFLLCFRTVEAGQVGIVTRFGEVNRTAESGAVVKLPFIERLVKMETRVQKEQQESLAATSDLQDVRATLALNYALDNDTAIRVYKEIGPDYKERIVIPAVQESFKSASAQYTAGELITERTAVKGKAFEVIKARLDKYNIRVVDLNIVNFNFSAEFSKALEEKQVALQEAQKAQFNLERARLDAQAQEAQKTSLSPELLRKMELDNQAAAIKSWNGNMPTYVGSGSVFNIPLTK